MQMLMAALNLYCLVYFTKFNKFKESLFPSKRICLVKKTNDQAGRVGILWDYSSWSEMGLRRDEAKDCNGVKLKSCQLVPTCCHPISIIVFLHMHKCSTQHTPLIRGVLQHCTIMWVPPQNTPLIMGPTLCLKLFFPSNNTEKGR